MKLTVTHLKDLLDEFGAITAVDVPLSQISQWNIGGKADVIIRPRSVEELSRVRAWISERDLSSVVIGSTSNLLFSDKGLRAICIQMLADETQVRIEGDKVIAGAGVWVPRLARLSMLAGLSGLEHTCGIPGTLGGLVYMNGGSQRKGIGDTLHKVLSVDRVGNEVTRLRDECCFEYRKSIFQRSDEVICLVELDLTPLEDKRAIRRSMLDILRERRLKFPRKLPNCGSVFVSDPDMYEKYGPPGKLLESLGFKGFSIGGMQVSERHANFIINRGAGSAVDALKLINIVRERVVEETGFLMKVEVRYVTESGTILEI